MPKISILRSESRIFLVIGSEQVEISDYKMESSANGTTELCVKITGTASELELKANLEGWKI